MTTPKTNLNITVRGGIINTPDPTTPTHPPRHQPNTPQTKKQTKPRSDHKIYGGDSSTTIKDSPPPQPATAADPTPAAAAPPVPPQPEPETDSEE